jgi:DNA segregation ATPase FtsK/SpoIIIE, S-DNA-T family
MAKSTRSTKSPASSRPKKNTSSKAKTTQKKKAAPAAPSKKTRLKWSGISGERKLDFFGIGIVLVGLLTFLSLLSSNRSTLFGVWIKILMKIAGWGTYLLPLGLVLVGLWLVFRNVKSLPVLSLERMTGIILIFLNLLTWFHLITGGGWKLAEDGRGGGFLGALLQLAFETTTGTAGTIIILIGWLLISLAITFDLSVWEMINRPIQWLVKLPGLIFQLLPDLQSFRFGESSTKPKLVAPETPKDLPPEFEPLKEEGAKKISRKKKTPSSSHKGEQSGDDSSIKTRKKSLPDEPGNPISSFSQKTISWILPTTDAILDPPIPTVMEENLEQERVSIIEESLASFGAPGHVVEIHRGPTITQYGVEPDFIKTRTGKMRVRVNKIASLADDLALALAASRIRIQAPVPGKNFVGIEVPNKKGNQVTLREILESSAFKKIQSPLRFGLGKDVAGKSFAADLKEMPHLLIAGTTGAGKSVSVNTILCSLLLFNSPKDLRLVLVDPKRVELTGYKGVPHLLVPVIVDVERVVGVLQWIMREMDSRYQKFSKAGVRNIIDFNLKRPDDYLPHIVLVIDELADLMMLAPDETERNISRLAQLARATGIHLILATQRPSTDVVTGLIKANFPARIAFAVASQVDSRVILDQPGAERLLGRGDMLFQAPDAGSPVRLQGAYVSDSEIQLLVDYWRFNAAKPVDGSISTDSKSAPPTDQAEEALPSNIPLHQFPLFNEKEVDPRYQDAIDLIRSEKRASITMLQRKFRIGYTRAARLIDTLEDQGIISPVSAGSQIRDVLDYGDEDKENSTDVEEDSPTDE